MYCPICSAIVAPDHRFCRICGFGLEKISESVKEQLPTKRNLNVPDPQNKFERLGVIALGIFGLGVGSFFLYIFAAKIIALFSQGRVLAAIGLIALLIVLGCGLLAAILFAKAKEVQKEPGKQPQKQGELSSTQPTERFLSGGEPTPIVSVTEQTTELLRTERGNDREQH